MATRVNFLDHAPDALFSLAASTLSKFEAPIGLERPLMRDYSRYQGFVNAGIAVANGVLLMMARAGISWGYHDARFQQIYQAFEGLAYRTSYHVLYPDQPVRKQFDQVWKFQQPKIEIIPRVIDLELRNGQTPYQIAKATREMSDIVAEHDNVRPLIYSRKNLIEEWLTPHWSLAFLNDHFFILAQYLWDRVREHPGPPDRPNGLAESQVFSHQTADKKPGFPGEVESHSVDYQRFEGGNKSDFYQFVTTTWGGVPEPPDIPPSLAKLFLMEILTNGLRIREEPNTNSAIVGNLTTGEVLQLTQDIYGHEGWGRIETGHFAGNFIAVTHQGTRHAKPYKKES